jgi:hypothetical protein
VAKAGRVAKLAVRPDFSDVPATAMSELDPRFNGPCYGTTDVLGVRVPYDFRMRADYPEPLLRAVFECLYTKTRVVLNYGTTLHRSGFLCNVSAADLWRPWIVAPLVGTLDARRDGTIWCGNYNSRICVALDLVLAVRLDAGPNYPVIWQAPAYVVPDFVLNDGYAISGDPCFVLSAAQTAYAEVIRAICVSKTRRPAERYVARIGGRLIDQTEAYKLAHTLRPMPGRCIRLRNQE